MDDEIRFLKFIIEKADTIIAANYLAYEQGFLYAQAIKDNFKLKISLPDEDEKRIMTFPAVLRKIAKSDVSLSFEIWTWCFKQFLPYNEYYDFCKKELSTDVIIELYKFPEGYSQKLAHYLSENEEFRQFFLTASSNGDICLGELIAITINEKLFETAKILYKSEIEKAGENGQEIILLTNCIIAKCLDSNETESIEFIKEDLISVLRMVSLDYVQFELTSIENFIIETINLLKVINSNCNNVKRSKNNTNFREDIYKSFSDQSYRDKLNEVKYGWQKKYIFQNKYGLNLNDFEYENEFRFEFNKKKEEIYEQKMQLMMKKDFDKEVDESNNIKELKIYTYCRISFPSYSQIYSYLADDNSIKIGDKVFAPFGKDNKVIKGTVVYVGQYLQFCVPYPIEKTKIILRKIQENTTVE